MRWSQLVVLMALGEGPEPLVHGVVAHRRGEGDDVGRLRVWRDGAHIRRETLAGTLTCLEHPGGEFWFVPPGGTVADHHRATHLAFPDHQLTRRRPLREWDSDDFTRPTGPVEPVEYLGRTAWRVEVAPPPRKPHPLTWVVDDATGLVLSAGSAGGTWVRWEQFEVRDDADPGRFTWTGDTRRARGG